MGDPEETEGVVEPGTTEDWAFPDPRRSPVPRSRDPVARGDPQAHRTGRHGRDRGPPGAYPGALVAEPPAQPDGLYIKRLLLFEPSVVVTSVPFHLKTSPVEIAEEV